MRRLRVLDLRDTYEIGGPGKTILETYRGIDAGRFDLHLGVFVKRHETGETPFVAAARAYGMPVHLVQGFNQFDPRFVTRLVDLVKTLRIDILHAHEVPSNLFTRLVRLIHPIPIVTTVHGWFGDGLKDRPVHRHGQAPCPELRSGHRGIGPDPRRAPRLGRAGRKAPSAPQRHRARAATAAPAAAAFWPRSSGARCRRP